MLPSKSPVIFFLIFHVVILWTPLDSIWFLFLSFCSTESLWFPMSTWPKYICTVILFLFYLLSFIPVCPTISSAQTFIVLWSDTKVMILILFSLTAHSSHPVLSELLRLGFSIFWSRTLRSKLERVVKFFDGWGHLWLVCWRLMVNLWLFLRLI